MTRRTEKTGSTESTAKDSTTSSPGIPTPRATTGSSTSCRTTEPSWTDTARPSRRLQGLSSTWGRDRESGRGADRSGPPGHRGRRQPRHARQAPLEIRPGDGDRQTADRHRGQRRTSPHDRRRIVCRRQHSPRPVRHASAGARARHGRPDPPTGRGARRHRSQDRVSNSTRYWKSANDTCRAIGRYDELAEDLKRVVKSNRTTGARLAFQLQGRERAEVAHRTRLPRSQHLEIPTSASVRPSPGGSRAEALDQSEDFRAVDNRPSEISSACHAVRRATSEDAQAISALYVRIYTPAGGGDARDYYPFPQIMSPDGVASMIAGGDVVWLVGEAPDGSPRRLRGGEAKYRRCALTRSPRCSGWPSTRRTATAASAPPWWAGWSMNWRMPASSSCARRAPTMPAAGRWPATPGSFRWATNPTPTPCRWGSSRWCSPAAGASRHARTAWTGKRLGRHHRLQEAVMGLAPTADASAQRERERRLKRHLRRAPA